MGGVVIKIPYASEVDPGKLGMMCLFLFVLSAGVSLINAFFEYFLDSGGGAQLDSIPLLHWNWDSIGMQL